MKAPHQDSTLNQRRALGLEACAASAHRINLVLRPLQLEAELFHSGALSLPHRLACRVSIAQQHHLQITMSRSACANACVINSIKGGAA